MDGLFTHGWSTDGEGLLTSGWSALSSLAVEVNLPPVTLRETTPHHRIVEAGALRLTVQDVILRLREE